MDRYGVVKGSYIWKKYYSRTAKFKRFIFEWSMILVGFAFTVAGVIVAVAAPFAMLYAMIRVAHVAWFGY